MDLPVAQDKTLEITLTFSFLSYPHSIYQQTLWNLALPLKYIEDLQVHTILFFIWTIIVAS